MGIITLNLKYLEIPRFTKFLIGFCICPFVLALWMIIVASILPGSPRWLFTLLPVLIPLLILIKNRSKIIYAILQVPKQSINLLKESWLNWVACLGIIIVLILAMSKLYINAEPPIYAHDATYYLSEARPFAEQRSLPSLNTFRGSENGTLRGDSHGPFWVAYLSNSLLFTDGEIGYPHDQATRIAFQITMIYMLLSIIALASITRLRYVTIFSLLFLFQIPQFEYISSQQSRDAFRIIPLLLLATVLAGLNLKDKPKLVHIFLVTILAAFSVQGHTLGIIAILTIILAWVLWNIIKGRQWISIITIIGFLGLGTIIGGSHYIASYLETGTVGGNNIGCRVAYEDTPLLDKARQADKLRLKWTTNRLDRSEFIFGKNDDYSEKKWKYSSNYLTNLSCFIGSLILIILTKKLIKDRNSLNILFIGLLAICTGIPFSGLLDSNYLELSQISVMNPRYPLQWYPFLAISGATFAAYVFKEALNWFSDLQENHKNRNALFSRLTGNIGFRITCIIFVLFLSYLSCSAFQTVSHEWSQTGFDMFEIYYDKPKLEPCKTAINMIPADKNLLVDWDNVSYYLNKPAIILTTKPAWGIIKAKSEKQVEIGLKKRNIGAVILPVGSINGFYDQVPLIKYLNNQKKAHQIIVNSEVRAYLIYD